MKKVTIISLSFICIALTYFVIKAKAAPQNAGHEYMLISNFSNDKAYIATSNKSDFKEDLQEKGEPGLLKKVKEYTEKGWQLKQMTQSQYGFTFLLEK